MNQKDALLRYLKQHKKGITSWTAAEALGVLRLSERVRELQAAGHKIEKAWSEAKPNRYGHLTRVMRYWLK